MSRSQWKFDYIGNDFQNIKKQNTIQKEIPYIVHNRATYINEDMLNVSVKIYNGMKYFSFIIAKDMLGHCLGEFAPTKKKAVRKKKIKIKKGK